MTPKNISDPDCQHHRQKSYILRLFVSGSTPQSLQAIKNLKKICQEYLSGNYELEVIDVFQKPQLARKYQILAVPALIKQLPPPMQKIIGDLSDTQQVLYGLNISPEQTKRNKNER
ncbi:MAG: circadian clock KaiB family protein [Spirochaetota bacterium]